MNDIIKECLVLENKYGHFPFNKALPYLQEGWESIGEKHGISEMEVFKQYMDWKSNQD